MKLQPSKMRRNIPLAFPVLEGNEWKYIRLCLDSGWVSSVGSFVQKFEASVQRYLGVDYAVATVNGTSALHVSLLSCGISPTDEVIVPALTFVAPVNTVRYCGAQPVFMDCDPETLSMNIEKTISFIKNNTIQKKDGFTYNKDSGKRIKAIIPVHVFGHPVDMDNLIKICIARHIDIIEDATESLGSRYKQKHVGTLGKVGCLSFNGNKIITTGGGGMVVTKDARLAKRIRHLVSQAKKDSLEYDHDEIGYNYRLTNIQAALGVAQMESLNKYIRRKRKNANLYKKLFSGIDQVKFLWEKPWAQSNFWFYTIKVPQRHKQSLINYLLEQGIQVRPIWKPINQLPMFTKYQADRLDNVADAYARCINLPCSVNLKEKEVRFIVKKVKEYFRK